MLDGGTNLKTASLADVHPRMKHTWPATEGLRRGKLKSWWAVRFTCREGEPARPPASEWIIQARCSCRRECQRSMRR